jgi:DNA helicase-2/ATP-dependent DNA helicase PcrA
MPDNALNPAEKAAQEALDHMYRCIDEKRSFLFEAGAGSGKTYSLIKALQYLIAEQGNELLRRHQRVACITYTNVAVDEIRSRTDSHPVVCSSTIHSFCWSLIRDFQPYLRDELPTVNKWVEIVEELEGIGKRTIGYDDLGRRGYNETEVSLHHDDVLALTVRLMEFVKFRTLFVGRYPILLIDEYQDTDRSVAEALTKHFCENGPGPLIGFFGDHWQKIYGTGCGEIEHKSLETIPSQSNFRSVPVVVEALNRMRPELPQRVMDPDAEGSIAVYHTNQWVGKRRTGQHWGGDLPADAAHKYLEAVKVLLTEAGWDLSPDRTKILMLTHRVLAVEQGYSSIVGVFSHNDAFVKKGDPHIKFFLDTLEPMCEAFEKKRFGEMLGVLGSRRCSIRSHSDKASWTSEMTRLVALRCTETIGEVISHLQDKKRVPLPDSIRDREKELEQIGEKQIEDESRSITQLRELRKVPYKEIIALGQFIDEHTPFSTKHGVKGAEFENVLVVMGRGWNQYNFNRFLELAADPSAIPTAKVEFYVRNRNLFYVVCSRPIKRLALMFTQELSDTAIGTLNKWFGCKSIVSLQAES